MRRDRSAIAAPTSRYGSLTAFYRADARRVSSREQDVGLWWREGSDGPLHRAAWVVDTGELYLVRLGPAADGGGRVEVLAGVTDASRLHQGLDGWRERCGEPGSLQWLRERAASLRPAPSLPRPPRSRRRHPRRTAPIRSPLTA